MASRMFWIFLVAVALVAGTLFQGRDFILGWSGDSAVERAIETKVENAVETQVEEAIEGSFERAQVVDSDGRTMQVAAETRHELGNAVSRLVSAETELALMRVRGASDGAEAAARARRDAAKADVEQLKAEIKRQDASSTPDRDLIRQQVQEDVRSTVRETVRSAVRG